MSATTFSAGALEAAKSDLGLLAETLGIQPRAGNHRCPLHHDRAASLSIHANERGHWVWKCHAGCGGGSIVDALVKVAGVSVAEACKRLSGGAPLPARRAAPGPVIVARTAPPAPVRDLETEGALARAWALDMEGAPAVLDYLKKRRGISAHTAAAFGLGVFNPNAEDWQCMRGLPGCNAGALAADVIRYDERGRIARCTWTLIILANTPPFGVLGVKLHRDPPAPGSTAKAGWLTRGGCALYPPPECQGLQPGQRIILTPGELKALACISAGLPATSLTTGESTRWTPELAERFRGLVVVLDPDCDRPDGTLSAAASTFMRNATAALSTVARAILERN